MKRGESIAIPLNSTVWKFRMTIPYLQTPRMENYTSFKASSKIPYTTYSFDLDPCAAAF